MATPGTIGGGLAGEGTSGQALLVGLPGRHLDAAVDACRAYGRVVIPAGSPGDLDSATPGMDVFLMISGVGAVPAATWRATFVRRVATTGPDDLPDLLPTSWLEDRRSDAAAGVTHDDERDHDPDKDDEDDEDDTGPQSFFEVERLEPLDKNDWLFANELVPKQERGGRAFFPRAPRLIRPPA